MKTQVPKKESPFRSLLKTISWRVIATLTTISIALVVTGQVDDALKIGLAESILKLIIYYFHERLWTNISWEKNWDRWRRKK